MPVNLSAKGSGEALRYTWQPSLVDGDAVLNGSVTVTSGTLTIEQQAVVDGNAVTFFVSGGVDGTTVTLTGEVETQQGETITDTLYLPVRATANAFGYNVGDILAYALRPVVGIGRTATAAELEDARENFNDMLAELQQSGAEMGIILPVQVSDTLYVADDFISALKNGLRVRIMGLYDRPLDQMTVMAAQRGLQRIKSQLLPDDRKATYF